MSLDTTITFTSIINVHPDAGATLHNEAQWRYLKEELINLDHNSKNTGQDMVIFVLHGYGSNGIDLRTYLFNWVGKIRLDLPFNVKVVLINWDGALSTDSQALLSANWAHRMLKHSLDTSVERSRQIGEKVVEVLNGFKGVVGVIGHSMGTHAAAVIIKKHTRVTFAMLLNPHLYNKDYNFDLKAKGRLFVAMNQDDKVLNSSQWRLNRSLGDMQSHPLFGFFDYTQRLKHLKGSTSYIANNESADIYDTDLHHGVYKHPMMRLNVIHLIRGGSFPPGVLMRGGFNIQPSAQDSCTHQLKLKALKPWEKMALDCYLITLRDYYQHHCLGLHLYTDHDRGTGDAEALPNAMPEELRQFDGMDWDAIDVLMPMLAPPHEQFLT